MAELRDKLAQDMDQIIDKVREQALAGDLQAARIVLDRVLPSLRPVEVTQAIDVPDGTLAAQAHAVVQAVAAGEITPSQAAQIITALGGVAKIIETTELVSRIKALEARHAGT